jgi:uncharacterized LabA/DUF88 family protein
MKNKDNNYAFIDSQNLHRGVKSLGWNLDYKKFRVYLAEKYGVKIAYLFIGYVQENQDLYLAMQKYGYVTIFKPTLPDNDGNIKGNVDADLVLQTMIESQKYEKAIIVTSDGDFYSLVKYLYEQKKLRTVISPYVKTCSSLLKKTAKEKIVFIDNLRHKLEYLTKNTAKGRNL